MLDYVLRRAYLSLHEVAYLHSRLCLIGLGKCVGCPFKGDGESMDYRFLHCPFTIGLWRKLFSLANLEWVSA